ncbi:MAG: MFS transporter, partial [Anaerolineaceae bacterium]|nr:MFS transporter [Anaerolineaceae bacterium]
MAAQFTEAENPTWKKKFFTIWSGQAISLIGSRLVGFALVWYLTDLTGSATVLATASLIGMLPEILLLPFAGALADRWNRRKVMIVADSGIALATLALAGLFFMGWVQIWHIYALMFVRSVCGSFHWPAMNASTSLLVPKEKYTRIQGVNQLLQGILSVVAAPLGALMMELMKVGNILMIDVITALIAVTPLFFLSIPQPDVLTQVKEGDSPLKTMLKDMREGLHYVVSWKGLFYVLIGATFINL